MRMGKRPASVLAAILVSVALAVPAFGVEGEQVTAESTTTTWHSFDTATNTITYTYEGTTVTVPVVQAGEDVNHGKVVSAFVHSLKDLKGQGLLEGGLGQYVREIAQSDYGKAPDDGEVAEITATETADDHPGQGEGHGKKDK